MGPNGTTAAPLSNSVVDHQLVNPQSERERRGQDVNGKFGGTHRRLEKSVDRATAQCAVMCDGAAAMANHSVSPFAHDTLVIAFHIWRSFSQATQQAKPLVWEVFPPGRKVGNWNPAAAATAYLFKAHPAFAKTLLHAEARALWPHVPGVPVLPIGISKGPERHIPRALLRGEGDRTSACALSSAPQYQAVARKQTAYLRRARASNGARPDPNGLVVRRFSRLRGVIAPLAELLLRCQAPPRGEWRQATSLSA